MKVVKPLGRTRNPESLKISLCDENPEVARTLADHFQDAEGVEVLAGNLFDLDCDALVSPANSFGDMSGGIDRQIDRFYEGAAQGAAVGRIAERFHGELPVGMATIIAMGTRRFPFLVVSPTMRVPGRVPGTITHTCRCVRLWCRCSITTEVGSFGFAAWRFPACALASVA